MTSPRKRAAEQWFRIDDSYTRRLSSVAAVARFRGLGILFNSLLGLTPQAYCCRPLRRLIAFISADCVPGSLMRKFYFSKAMLSTTTVPFSIMHLSQCTPTVTDVNFMRTSRLRSS